MGVGPVMSQGKEREKVVTLRVQNLVSHPAIFSVPSTLKILLGTGNFLVPIPRRQTIE